jgi:hypothetical protein
MLGRKKFPVFEDFEFPIGVLENVQNLKDAYLCENRSQTPADKCREADQAYCCWQLHLRVPSEVS